MVSRFFVSSGIPGIDGGNSRRLAVVVNVSEIAEVVLVLSTTFLFNPNELNLCLDF